MARRRRKSRGLGSSGGTKCRTSKGRIKKGCRLTRGGKLVKA